MGERPMAMVVAKAEFAAAITAEGLQDFMQKFVADGQISKIDKEVIKKDVVEGVY